MDPAKLHSREHSNPKTKFTKGKGNREEGVLNPQKKKKSNTHGSGQTFTSQSIQNGEENKQRIKETEKRS